MHNSYYMQLKERYQEQERIAENKRLGLKAQYAQNILNTMRRDIVVSTHDTEIAGCKCKQISITLPECEGSHGFSLTFSISNEKFYIRDGNFFNSYKIFSKKEKEELEKQLEKSSKLKERLYDKKELFERLIRINGIMKSHGLPTDSDIKDDSGWRQRGYEAINFIKELVRGKKELERLESASLWLSDSKIYENNNFHACVNINEGIIDEVGEKRCHMLLK